ncbi:hypothetical protein BK653_08450 [Pseudomonas brassicacearum]|uniref:hypothetical protein n=1 Tax=Pseudomonas brassicacearum TaxID=930166 RepID=UPI000F4A9419|nr:hypothetical protein [Pseudomonas brassicacearum]ROM71902.1 hypothetical protein BK653_08450 [Pseudomonas brassicacearum]
MSISIGDFFYPYVKFLHGAAYNLHQILEGLGVVSSTFTGRNDAGQIIGTYWSPDEAMVLTLGYLMLLSLLLIPLLAAAAFTVSKKRGVFIFFALLSLPGMLNCLGLFPIINYLPIRYTINGVGKLGSEVGLIPLLMLCALTGWGVMVLIYDNLNLTERFRQLYDHFWFPLALVAAVFFVADNGANEDAALLKEATASIQDASAFLLSQIRRYDDYCKANGLGSLKSCQWSSDSQWTFTHIKEGESGYFIDFAPNESKGFYAATRRAISDEDVIAIRKEINDYNQRLCPVKYFSNGMAYSSPLSSTCEYVPHGYCSDNPDGPPRLVDKNISSHTVALASECIVPWLAGAKPSLKQLSALVSQHDKAKNHRWLYFLAVAVAVGAKVALATTKLCLVDARPADDRRRVLRVARQKLGQCARIMRRSLVGFRGLAWFAAIRAAKVFKRGTTRRD